MLAMLFLGSRLLLILRVEFEKNLMDHLQEQSVQEGRSVGQLKIEVAYERFLARMDPESMIIKGGYAVKSQVPINPYTREI